MNKNVVFPFLLIIAFLIACNDDIGPTLNPEVRISYAIPDHQNPWKGEDILTDSVSIKKLDSILMIDIADINISDPEDVNFIKNYSDPDGQQLLRSIRVETENDMEVFTNGENVFVYGHSYGMSVINGVEHYSTDVGMLIPVKIGKTAKINNDTLELSLTEIDFVKTYYKSPINELEVTHKVYFK
jgi:hypothetical protein